MSLLSRRLRLAREYRKLSPQTIDERASFPMYHYFECEHGVVIPSLEELIAIADVLDCPAGWLIGTKEEREAFASGDRKVIGKVKAPWE